MKDVLLDANFPRDAKGATYHVGTKPGEVANRIITVGDHVRARRIAKHFHGPCFEYQSQRNFLTLTGTYRGVPITVVAIGMGFSLVDFFVRECRAVVAGEMIIVRLGSCGSIDPEVPIGTVVVPLRSYGITRTYDYFHPTTTAEERAAGLLEPYTISKPLDCDGEVHDALLHALQSTAPQPAPGSSDLFGGQPPKCAGQIVNGSADSFYSSQGRTSAAFLDANANLVDTLRERHSIQTLEMETFVLNHLAVSANVAAEAAQGQPNAQAGTANSSRIRTGAVQMIFANRHTSAFITPEEVHLLEDWSGKAVCEALAGLHIPPEHLQREGVWSK